MLVRFLHQADIFHKTKDLEFYAYELEVRCGKSLIAVDTVIHNYEQGRIDAALIVAPNTVDLNWSRIGLPEYVDEMRQGNLVDLNKNSLKVMAESRIFEWSKSKSKTFSQECADLLTHPGLIWFCVNLEGIADRVNSKGRTCYSRMQEYIELFIARRKVFLICDEAHKFAKPDSKCTAAMIRLAQDTKMRRNLTGTPITDKPLDVWSEYNILSPSIIHNELGEPMRWTTFKSTFAYWKHPWGAKSPYARVLDPEQGDKGYKNLDKLYALIDPYRSRLTQKELYAMDPVAFSYFKEPVFERRIFEMSDKQQKVYDKLRDDFIVQLDSGETITAEQAMTNMLRLQQVSRGYVGGADSGEVVDLGAPYPSIELLLDYIEQIEGQIIVWCNFTADIELILRVLKENGIKALRYDGKVTPEERTTARQLMWEDPSIQVVVGNPAAGGLGVDMAFAATMLNYSFNFRMDIRKQAIGRFQGPKQKSPILLHVDFVAAGTNDYRCLQALDGKEDLASILTGDKKRLKAFLMGEK